MSLYESKALREDEFVYYAPKLIDRVKEATLKSIQQFPLLMYPPKYFMYRTLKAYVGNGQQNLHIRGSRLSNPYTMIDYCGKNESGCIMASEFSTALQHHYWLLPLEKPFKLQVCFAYKK